MEFRRVLFRSEVKNLLARRVDGAPFRGLKIFDLDVVGDEGRAQSALLLNLLNLGALADGDEAVFEAEAVEVAKNEERAQHRCPRAAGECEGDGQLAQAGVQQTPGAGRRRG